MKINTLKIKKIMSKNLLTQSALAEAANVSRITINATLLKGSCSVQTVNKIAKALNVAPEYLVQED